jgi:hypothetical protein
MTACVVLSEVWGLCRLRVVFRHAAISPIHRRHLANPQARWVTLLVDRREQEANKPADSSALRSLSLELHLTASARCRVLLPPSRRLVL